MVAFIIAVAAVFGWNLTAEGITTEFSDFMLSNASNKWIFFLIVLGILGVMGVFIEEAAIMIMTLPILYPDLWNRSFAFRCSDGIMLRHLYVNTSIWSSVICTERNYQKVSWLGI